MGAVDWGRDARAEARRLGEVPEKRARSGFRVGLSHDSIVRTYKKLHSHKIVLSEVQGCLSCVAVHGVWIERHEGR